MVQGIAHLLSFLVAFSYPSCSPPHPFPLFLPPLLFSLPFSFPLLFSPPPSFPLLFSPPLSFPHLALLASHDPHHPFSICPKDSPCTTEVPRPCELPDPTPLLIWLCRPILQ